MFSSVPMPDPLPQQKVCSRMVSSGISKKLLHEALMIARGSSKQAHGAGRVARVVVGDAVGVVPGRVELELPVMNKVGGEFADVYASSPSARCRSASR